MQLISNPVFNTCFDCGKRKGCPADYLIENPAVTNPRGAVRNTSYAANETLFTQGSGVKNLFFVKSGSIKNIYTGEEGDQQIIGFYFSGDLIVPVSLKHSCHLSTAVALEASIVCVFPLNFIVANCEKLPHLQANMLRHSEAEIKHHHEWLLGVNHHSALNRLCAFLLDLIYRQRLDCDNSALLNLTMTRADIGNYLGLAPETVSRNFSKLKEQGLVIIQKKRLKLNDLKKLEHLLD